MFKKILVLSPHTDDGELGCGGTISKFVKQGKDVYYVAFSSCKKSVPKNYPKDILKKECLNATQLLGVPKSNIILLNFEVREFPKLRQEILDCMIIIRNNILPDLVISPSSFDMHQDHQVIYNESIRAFKKISSIWGMEHPWNNLSFRTDIFVELKEEHIEKKIDCLKKYNSQSLKDYFKEDYIKACGYIRGMAIGIKYAEVFECIRMRV